MSFYFWVGLIAPRSNNLLHIFYLYLIFTFVNFLLFSVKLYKISNSAVIHHLPLILFSYSQIDYAQYKTRERIYRIEIYFPLGLREEGNIESNEIKLKLSCRWKQSFPKTPVIFFFIRHNVDKLKTNFTLKIH